VNTSRPWRIAVDRGGTFTDVVAHGADGSVVVRKVPSDADDRDGDRAVRAIREITSAPDGVAISIEFVTSVRCGTTVATNALLERRGERTALFVTEGFRDLLTIGSGERPDLFALHVVRPEPLPECVFEVPERLLADGTVRTPLDESALRAAARAAREAGLSSAAVVFLHAYRDGAHELRAGEILRDEGFDHVALSHEVAREVKVVPRGSTAAADAYLTPVLRRSLERFRAAFDDAVDVRFMQSHGGLCDVAHAAGPRAVLSGPAGGVLASGEVAALDGADAVIGFDMGGTSTDVCRWSGEPDLVYETRAAGVCLRVPSLRIETVAAGGGSMLTFDGRRLRVGPQSVGARPGPAGYGRGGAAAVTDANAVLGRLVPERFPRCFGASGDRPFDVEASRAALVSLATEADLDVHEAAAGFLRIAVARMAQAIREISVQRGHDVRTHALVCFGGAGAGHACSLARALGMRRVLLHPLGSVLSAWGIGGALSSHEEAAAPPASGETRWTDDARAIAVALCAELEQKGRERLAAEGVPAARIEVSHDVELAYAGVDHSLAVPLRDVADTRSAFDAAHTRLFGFAREDAAVELRNVRVRTYERPAEAESRAAECNPGPSPPAAGAATHIVQTWFDTGDGARPHDTPVFDLGAIAAGTTIRGPALAVDDVTTVVVEPGWTARADVTGLLVMEAEDVAPPPAATCARDPVFLALFANTFMSIAERMGGVLERVSLSTSIKERLDFSCAVFDGDGRLVANAPHIPVHLGAMGESVRAVADCRRGKMREGDAYLTNDPYAGGSHLPDVTVVPPVLARGGRPRFFVGSRAHHADVGGITPGSMPANSKTIEEEGVCIHDLLLADAGEFRESAARVAFLTGRFPTRGIDERISDLRAQVAANTEGARLLREQAETHGADVVAAYMGHVLDDGEEAMRETLRELPDGVHTATDSDGLGLGVGIGPKFRVAIAIDGDDVVVDFAGTSGRDSGNLNTPRAVSRAAVLYALRTLVRRDIPLNEGCLRPVTVRVPGGSLLDPQPPSAVVGGNVETSMRLVDLVLGALGACAAGQGTMNNLAFGRLSGRGGTYYETICGGTGAGPGFAGADAIQSHMTNTRITDPEVLERRWQVVLRRFGIRRGSGGEGAFRGGDGAVREIEFLEPVLGGMLSSRRPGGAFGLAGGGSGDPGRNVLVRDGARHPLGDSFEMEFRPGDVLHVETPGGGGYGRVTSGPADADGP